MWGVFPVAEDAIGDIYLFKTRSRARYKVEIGELYGEVRPVTVSWEEKKFKEAKS